MKLGQTSFVYFVSRLLASVLGFVATIYFARLLGAEPLGIYYLVLGVVSWLGIVGKIGVTGAITKRVSEGEEREQYAAAGALLIIVLFAIITVGLFFFRSYVDNYVGHPVTEYIALILLATLVWSFIASLLNGLHLVHVKGILSPVETGAQSLLQIGAVAIGLGLTGLFLGYVGGFLIAIAIGGIFVFRHLRTIALPERHHFQSLFDYAKFAWLGSLQSRMFNYTDVIILGFFVPSALIGIYSIAWNIAQFLILFAGAISTTLFPEMSELSANQEPQSVANLIEDALSYAGLLLIPGLIGGLIIGEPLLRVYGDEFTQGATILAILIVANLFMSYQNQILNTLNAINRPDLSFRANTLFVVANLSLNVVLIYLYGWLGAAVATVLSVGISLIVAHQYLASIIDFSMPYHEIANQWIAALCMGGVVYLARSLGEANLTWVDDFNAVFVVLLVGLGASVYFILLLGISSTFRTTVTNNIPFTVPLLNR